MTTCSRDDPGQAREYDSQLQEKIVGLLSRFGRLSRREIAERVDLSVVTVYRIMTKMVAQKKVSSKIRDKDSCRGRPPVEYFVRLTPGQKSTPSGEKVVQRQRKPPKFGGQETSISGSASKEGGGRGGTTLKTLDCYLSEYDLYLLYNAMYAFARGQVNNDKRADCFTTLDKVGKLMGAPE